MHAGWKKKDGIPAFGNDFAINKEEKEPQSFTGKPLQDSAAV